MAKRNSEMTGWVGWIGFASLMLTLAGFFHILAGIVALFKDDVFVTAHSNVWVLDYSQWGWIHILGGILALLAAGSLASGQMFGRIFAVLVALASAVASMAFVPVYPIWSIMIVAVDILVIWAVIAHGTEVREM
jgi:hypothetical protein